MAANDKDTIYIDIDDEITGIIDKVRASNGKVVALVLPKRAAVFQSIVNMKLLKRAADSAKKHLVLITTEAGLLPLAGAAGVHVAQTLNSKPSIPVGPDAVDDMEEMVEETGDEPEPEYTAETAGDKPIGELAGIAPAAAADGVETLELDDEPEATAAAPAVAAAAAPKVAKDSKLKVPNFDRFRLWLILGGLALVLLIILLVVAMNILPKATINISTDATNVNSSLGLKLSTAAKTLDTSNNTVPAKAAQQQKTYSQQVGTTGQKNNGNKAQGSVTMTAGSCSGDVPSNVAAGTPLTGNSLTYILGDDVSFVPTVSHGKCTFQGVNSNGGANIPMTAQSGGANYNGSGTYSVYHRSDVTASGSASGGTDSIVQIVSQTDINNAKNKISTDDSTVKQALQDQLQHDGYYAIAATYNAGTPAETNSANVGDAANNVTVTEVVTYTMFGVHRDDLKTLVDNDIKDQIDTSKQSILSEGLDQATFNVNSSSGSEAAVTMSTTATAGPQLDIAGIRRDAAGKKPGDIKSQLQANPDVTAVDVKLSPFWVNSVPKKASKITVNIEKPKTTAGKPSASQ